MDNSKNGVKALVGLAIGFAVLFGTAWALSKGWKTGQK